MGAPKPINLIYAISFMDLFSVGLFFPVFSQHLRDLGASHTTVGILTSSYSLIQVLSGPLIGSWSDIRSRKTVLKYTVLLCSVCYGLLGTTKYVSVILILRLFLGTFKHTQTICKAVITDLLPPKEQSEIFAKSASLGSLGFIIGPFIGGNLAELPNGFTYVCLLSAGLFASNYVLSCYLPEEPSKSAGRPATPNTSISNSVKSEFKKSVLEIKEVDWSHHWDTFLLKFLLGFTMTCYFSNQAIYLQEVYHLSHKHTGYMISFFSTIGIISGLFLEKIDNIFDTSSIYTKMCVWYLVLLLSFIGLYFSPNLIIFLIVLIPLSLSATAMRVVTMELMFKKSESFHKGSLSGASNSVMSISRFITPLFTGITSDIFSERSVMLIAVIPASLGLLVSFYMKGKEKHEIKNK